MRIPQERPFAARKTMQRFRALICILCTTMVAPPFPVFGQMTCGQPVACQDYRLTCQTVYEQQPTTTYRMQSETVMHQRQVVSYRPVTETTTRERRYRVAKPVTETSHREERMTVMRPVYETKYRDMSYNRVRYVNETSSRVERRVVQRPVTETSYREERRVVQKPVSQTVMQDQSTTAMVPHTTYRQQLVDRGQYADQLLYKPGDVRNRLRWQGRGCDKDPVTGECQFRRAGLYWQQQQQPGTYATNRVYVPNVGVQQIAETQYIPQQYTRKVAVPVTSYVPEVQARRVPVQTVRMVQEEQVRRVPVTTQRPVVERVANYVPERTVKWVPQEMVRRVPVTTQKVVYEDRVEQVPVTTTRMVAEYKTVEVPQTTRRWVPETTMRQVPRTVMMKVPVAPVVPSCDACGNVSYATPISHNGYTTTPATTTYPSDSGPTLPADVAPTISQPSFDIQEPAPPTGPITNEGDEWRRRSNAPVLEFGPSARRPKARTARANIGEGGWRAVAKKETTDNIRLSSAE